MWKLIKNYMGGTSCSRCYRKRKECLAVFVLHETMLEVEHLGRVGHAAVTCRAGRLRNVAKVCGGEWAKLCEASRKLKVHEPVR